jgi:anti-anti-sigma regulatory factor
MDIIIHQSQEQPGQRTLTLQGELSMRNATAVRQALMAALAEHLDLHIVLSEVASLDLSVLQLLFAARQTPGRQVTVEANLPPSITEVVQRAGLLELIFTSRE